jgi:hypothetical protein
MGDRMCGLNFLDRFESTKRLTIFTADLAETFRCLSLPSGHHVEYCLSLHAVFHHTPSYKQVEHVELPHQDARNAIGRPEHPMQLAIKIDVVSACSATCSCRSLVEWSTNEKIPKTAAI